MNSLNDLKKLESELRETKDFHGKQKQALALAKKHFKSYIGKNRPPAEKMNKDYLKLYYEQVQNSILHDRDQALKNIGIGIAISEKINSFKFELDFLSKAQYVLYEIFEFPYVAMSLGHYIVLHTEDYENRQGWTHFHNGNIWLDLEEFNQAKEEYEQAKELAIKMRNKNAEMTIYERLGLVCRKLKEWDKAEDYYTRSEDIESNGNIQYPDSIKNKVR
jgi:tetratricopeptide (TPR) repeat protein